MTDQVAAPPLDRHLPWRYDGYRSHPGCLEKVCLLAMQAAARR